MKKEPKPRQSKSKTKQEKNAKIDKAILTGDVNKGPGTFAQRTMARVMSEKGMTTRQIAAQIGVSHQTVAMMLKYKEDEIAMTVAGRLSDTLPARIAGILDRIAAELETRDLSKAPLHHLSLLFGTLFDKRRLACGQSTGNVSVLVKLQAMADAEEAKRLAGPAKAPALESPAEDADLEE